MDVTLCALSFLWEGVCHHDCPITLLITPMLTYPVPGPVLCSSVHYHIIPILQMRELKLKAIK